MSLLLNNMFNGIMPSPKAILGVSIGRNRLYAAHVETQKKDRRVIRITESDLPFGLFRGSPTQEVSTTLGSSLAELCSDIRRSHIPVQIALPDPVVTLRLFELDALPKSAKEQQALARWRFAKEAYFENRAIECVCQYFGEENGKHLLLALAADQNWFDCLKEAFHVAGVTATVIDMAACYRFNRFYDRLTAESGDAVLISMDHDTWTLSISDAQGRLRFVHARWREEIHEREEHRLQEYQDIASETEQMIRVYVHAAAGRNIGNIHVTANAENIIGMASVFDHRMQGKCVRLPAGMGFSINTDISQGKMDDIGDALAAAIVR